MLSVGRSKVCLGIPVTPTTLFAPAKLNLFLAITGRRADGFHDLVSVVAALDFGDRLELTLEDGGVEPFGLSCTDPDVPCDDTNLVLRAARAWAAATGWRGAARFHLEKRVPMGAGLGGGSSDGVAALKLLNSAAGSPLSASEMVRVAATLGSDCPLFLADGPVIMRGRGERLEPLPEQAARRLRGRRVLVFKPAFGISTPWAYGRLAEMAAAGATKQPVYLPPAQAESRLGQWIASAERPLEDLVFNNLELPAFEKHVALPTLLDALRRDFGLTARMTGSGSACFALLPDTAPVDAIKAAIRRAWGESTFIAEATIAQNALTHSPGVRLS